MEPTQLENIILALLFASEEPLSLKKVMAILEDVPLAEVKAAVSGLEARIAQDYPSIVVERVAGGLQLATSVAYADYIARLYSGKRKQRLSKAAMEAMAVIAYKQPITRVEIETIRGVGCGGVITTLMERSLIRIVGKAKVLGAPFLYGTTPEFLEYLGLNSLKDLPSMDELEALLEHEEETREQGGPETSGEQRESVDDGGSSIDHDGDDVDIPDEQAEAEDEAPEVEATDDIGGRAASARVDGFRESPSQPLVDSHEDTGPIDNIPTDAKE